MKKNHIIIASVVVLGLLFSLAAYFYNSQQMETKNNLATKHSSALIPFHAIKKGNPKAKVTIVEFLDPACGTCKKFHPRINELLKEYPEKLNVVVRYAPFHHGSDKMVAILEASRKQKQFWNVLDIMFETQEGWTVNHRAKPKLFWNYLKGYGFDITQIQKDMKDPTITKIIEKDLADGKLLGVRKTPTFFVNGKPLPSFGLRQLRNLVENEIAANY